MLLINLLPTILVAIELVTSENANAGNDTISISIICCNIMSFLLIPTDSNIPISFILCLVQRFNIKTIKIMLMINIVIIAVDTIFCIPASASFVFLKLLSFFVILQLSQFTFSIFFISEIKLSSSPGSST